MSYARFALVTFDNLLGALDHLAQKALDAGMADSVLAARLTDDMFPLELQFRVAINQALLAVQQVGGRAVPLDEAAYGSLAEIRERIAAARVAIADSGKAGWLGPKAGIDLTLPNGVRFVMTAEDDVRDWLLPNCYFHTTMAYALLRAEGLEIGKMDFLPHMARHVRRHPTSPGQATGPIIPN